MYTLTPFRRHLPRELANPLATDRFFRSFFDVSDMVGAAGFRVDVRDKGDAFLLEAELPGVTKESINLTLQEDALVISADLNEEKKEEKAGYLYSERRTGHVERRFNLEGIQADGIAAAYENGVLTVTLPKAQAEPEKDEVRKIEIE